MDIGVPRERRNYESRVGLTPAGVAVFAVSGALAGHRGLFAGQDGRSGHQYRHVDGHGCGGGSPPCGDFFRIARAALCPERR